jgi:murein DD-endopeptidase MepM/ murein hydrolase activator NlpD
MPRVKILPKYQGVIGTSQVTTSTTTMNMSDFSGAASIIFNSPGFKRARALGINPSSGKTTGNEGTFGAVQQSPPKLTDPAVVKTTTLSPIDGVADMFRGPLNFGNSAFGRAYQKFDTGLNIANAGLNYFDIRKKQKEFDAWNRQSLLPDNNYAVDTKLDKGDWEKNDGGFQPNTTGYKSKGTQANPYYASRNFVRYGGLIKAADGMLVPGDQIVNKAFLPDVNAADAFIGASPVQMQSSSAPSLESSSSADADYSDQDYVLPVENFKLTSGFGPRKSPTKGASSNHNGLDLAVPENTNVRSIKDGTIYKMWEDGHGGKQMLIKHDDGSVSGYAHLNSYNFKLNDRVRKGQNVALSGNTGTSTGPHLHFTYRPNLGSDAVDPRNYLNFDLSGKKSSGSFSGGLAGTIAQKESGGDYRALPYKKDGTLASSAVGKYQFLWNQNSDWITQVTGVRSKEEFRNNPEAQERAFQYWDRTVLTPHANKIKSELGVKVPINNIKYAIHFAGPTGAYQYFKTGKETRDAFGSTTSKYANLEYGGQNNNNMKIRIVGLKKYQGDEEGSTVGSGGGKPVISDEELAAATGRPSRTIVTRPVGFGINFNDAQGEGKPGTYDLSLGYRGTVGKEGFKNSAYTAGLTLPGIIRGKGNIGVTGELDRNHYSVGTNMVLPVAGGNLKIKGGYDRQTGNNVQQGSDPSFMQSANNQQGQSRGNFHGGLEYNKSFRKGPNVKISATYGSAPQQMAKGGQPQYSGQSDYGLYIGQRNLYSSMPENPFKSPNNIVTEEEPTEENPHVLEAEGGGKNKIGETILRPDGTHNFILGNRHTDDGVKLNRKQAPPGSFIYSDTGKMKIRDPKILKHFGQSGEKGMTPAKLARQYDVNKFLAILKDPYADALQKQTAMRMVENYQIKLAELALVQEGIKGYPQGVPEVAKAIVGPEQQAQIEQKRQQQGGGQEMPMQRFGGYPQYVDKGEVAEEEKSKEQTTKDTTKSPTTSGTEGVGRPTDNRSTTNDPFGVKNMLTNSGKTATVKVTKAPSAPVNPGPLVGQTRANPTNPQQEEAWDGTKWIPKAEYEQKFLNTTDPSKNTGAAQSPVSAQRYNMPNWFKLWTKSNTPEGRKSPKGRISTYDETQAPKDHLYKGYEYWRNRAGRDFTGPADFQKYVFGELQKENPEAMQYIEKEWGPTAAGKYDDSIFGARTTYAMQQTIPVKTTTKSPEPTPTTSQPPATILTSSTTKPPGGSIPVPTTTLPPRKKIPPKGKWTSQDARNFGNAIADYATLRKYYARRQPVQPVLPQFIPVDWRGMAASLQSSQNAAANQIGTFQGGNAMGANLSFLQGQTGNQLGQYISQTDQYNAAGATAKDSERAGILNQFNMYNAENLNKNWDDNNVYDDRYRRAEREARKGIVKTWNQAEHNASKIYNLNQTEKYFNTDPWTQKIYFKSDAAKAAWEAETRGGSQPNEDEAWAARYAALMNDKNLAMMSAKERSKIVKERLTGNSGGSTIKTQKRTDGQGNVSTVNTVTSQDDDDVTGGSFKKGGSVAFVKAVDSWYKKLNYIADPEERQRVALAYARVMES